MHYSRMMLTLGLMTAFVGLLVLPVQSYQEVEVTNGGTIQGRVIFVGAPPPMRHVIPTKDKEVCGGPRQEPRIILGPNQEVKDAIVYLKDVEKGKPWDKPDKTPVIDNVTCRFTPKIQVVPAGNIRIHNADPVLHNTHGYYRFDSRRRTAFNVALPNKGDQVERALRRPGITDIECDAHGWMQGWVLVADNPYYATTPADGSFTLANVPPGTYTLETFQHYTGAVETSVTVKPQETVNVTVELKP